MWRRKREQRLTTAEQEQQKLTLRRTTQPLTKKFKNTRKDKRDTVINEKSHTDNLAKCKLAEEAAGQEHFREL